MAVNLKSSVKYGLYAAYFGVLVIFISTALYRKFSYFEDGWYCLGLMLLWFLMALPIWLWNPEKRWLKILKNVVTSLFAFYGVVQPGAFVTHELEKKGILEPNYEIRVDSAQQQKLTDQAVLLDSIKITATKAATIESELSELLNPATALNQNLYTIIGNTSREYLKKVVASVLENEESRELFGDARLKWLNQGSFITTENIRSSLKEEHRAYHKKVDQTRALLEREMENLEDISFEILEREARFHVWRTLKRFFYRIGELFSDLLMGDSKPRYDLNYADDDLHKRKKQLEVLVAVLQGQVDELNTRMAVSNQLYASLQAFDQPNPETSGEQKLDETSAEQTPTKIAEKKDEQVLEESSIVEDLKQDFSESEKGEDPITLPVDGVPESVRDKMNEQDELVSEKSRIQREKVKLEGPTGRNKNNVESPNGKEKQIQETEPVPIIDSEPKRDNEIALTQKDKEAIEFMRSSEYWVGGIKAQKDYQFIIEPDGTCVTNIISKRNLARYKCKTFKQENSTVNFILHECVSDSFFDEDLHADYKLKVSIRPVGLGINLLEKDGKGGKGGGELTIFKPSKKGLSRNEEKLLLPCDD